MQPRPRHRIDGAVRSGIRAAAKPVEVVRQQKNPANVPAPKNGPRNGLQNGQPSLMLERHHPAEIVAVLAELQVLKQEPAIKKNPVPIVNAGNDVQAAC